MKKEKFFSVSALIAAVISALCCIGPLIFLALGIGTISAFIYVEKYRIWIITLTVLFLGFAFYFTYKKKKIICEDGSCKYVPTSALIKRLLWTVTVVAVVFMTLPYWLPYVIKLQQQPAKMITVAHDEIIIDIHDMSCPSCAVKIQGELKKIPGVLNAEVNYEEKRAIVDVTPGEVTNEQLLEAIKDNGYTATIKEKKYINKEGL